MKKLLKKIAVLVMAGTLCVSNAALPVYADGVVIDEGTSTSSTTTLKKKAASIVKKQVKTGDSKKAKLKKLFKYVEKNYGYQRVTGFKNTKGWEKTYAQAMYKSKKGSCYHYAAAYAFLAKSATGYPVRVCVGKTRGFSGKWQAHAWTEVKIGSKWYICDANMDKFAAKSSLKYYLKSANSASMKKIYKTTSRITVKF